MGTYEQDLIAYLSGFVTPNRLKLFRQILDQRTRYITVLMEDIYQSQNASAVLRTCDCTGIQDVHVVEQRNAYQVNPDVALGSDQWLTMHYYRSGSQPLQDAVGSLKKEGYRIVATTPHREGSTPEEFDLMKGKAAIMFGTEMNGLTEPALELADEAIRIPMVGFTESFNISVSAAVILYDLRKRLEKSGLHWKLTEDQRTEVLLEWLRQSVKMSKPIEEKFRNDRKSTFS